MSELYEFMGASPFLTALIVVVIGGVLIVVCRVLVVLPNRIMRHRNIHKHGYPPAHCDADGDFKENSDDQK